jgi:hypothetical protein
MKTVIDGNVIKTETGFFLAQVKTEGYVSGVAAGTFIDKQTGAKDLGFGLGIVDFLLEPIHPYKPCGCGLGFLPTPLMVRLTPNHYHYGDVVHGNIAKRYVELPQICTQAKSLSFEIIEGSHFVAVKQWFYWTIGIGGRKPCSKWEQWLVFPDGKRYFFACDVVTSTNNVENLILRIDMPGHLKHREGDSFQQIYLSYHGYIPASEFLKDFPPDARFIYQRDRQILPPERMIRAYQTKIGLWLAGMTLNPNITYEAWCHQRPSPKHGSYVCFIQEIGGFPIKVGGSFSAAYIYHHHSMLPNYLEALIY